MSALYAILFVKNKLYLYGFFFVKNILNILESSFLNVAISAISIQWTFRHLLDNQN